MRRIAPLLTCVLVVMWLVLNDSLAAGSLLVGCVLALVLGWWAGKLRPLRPHLHRPHLAIGLLVAVFIDIVRSNIAVGRIILGLVSARGVRSGYLDIPLELHDPHGLAVLAMIITSTPGTVWVDMNDSRSMLRLHVLDLQDEAAWVHTIKERYERPLIGIFQP